LEELVWWVCTDTNINTMPPNDEKKRLLPYSAQSSPSAPAKRKPYYSNLDCSLNTLTVPRSRIRSNSVTIFTEDGEDITSTSYGPVMVVDRFERRDWLLGWFLAIISGILFTGNNFFVKYLSVDAIEMLLMRSGMQTLLLGIVLMTTTGRLLPEGRNDKMLVILQGMFSGGRIFLQFACLSYMPLGDALTLVFTEPLWTLLLSKLVLKIKIGIWKMIFGVVLLAGMVFCIQPPFLFSPGAKEDHDIPNVKENSTDTDTLVTVSRVFGLRHAVHVVMMNMASSDVPYDNNYYVGVLLAVSTAITGATANVIIAKCESVSSSVMVFFSGLGGMVLALLFSIFDEDNKIIFSISSISLDQWLILAMLGAMGIVGYFSLTKSLQLIPPTTVAVLRAMEIILAYIAQAVVMGEVPDNLSITGSSMVMFSVVAFALEELIMGCF